MTNLDIKEIQDLFISKKMTLSLAESCTGGRLAATLTRIPGSSGYFLGSVVAYSNFLKTKLLGVEARALENFGAVSPQVVLQMAEGILEITGSDYSIAVSGIAGPEGGTPSKPVGTIWAAIAHKGNETFIWNFNLSGTRNEIIDQCIEILLSQLCKKIVQ